MTFRAWKIKSSILWATK